MSDSQTLSDSSSGVRRFDHQLSNASDPDRQATAELNLPATIGRYVIRSLINRGRFGTVYLAHDQQLGRQVAIKVPRVDDDVARAAFAEEARRLAQLSHPSIVRVYDVGADGDCCYIVTEYLQGLDLRQWTRRNSPDWRSSVRIAAALADALALAHAERTIHRDVKPTNVIVIQKPEGVVPVLVDFGLALSDLGETPDPRKVSGTPNYMSPEQARGQAHQIDGRTDIYSLGVVLYQMLSGRLPFRAKRIERLLEQLLNDEPQPLRQLVPDLPLEVERICLKAMAKRVEDRYPTATDLVEDLRALLQTSTLAAESITTAPPPLIQPRRREAMDILIVDDEPMGREKLRADLENWGHRVTAATDGDEAWELFQQHRYSIVITDWIMPRMDGLELVRRIRESDCDHYVYLILLTAKDTPQDLVAGLGVGADDFLSKPVHRDELQMRVRAGARITRLNHELSAANRQLTQSVVAAARMQQRFASDGMPEAEGYRFARSSVRGLHLGGDMLGAVRLDDQRLGMFMVDVAGDSVPAALLAATMARDLALYQDGHGSPLQETAAPTSPGQLLQRVHAEYARSLQPKQLVSAAYAVLETDSGLVRFAAAGHTPLIHHRSDGQSELLTIESYPIGLAPVSEPFPERTVQLEAGERLFIYSDGLTDSLNEDGEPFTAARLLDLIAATRTDSLAIAVGKLTSAVDRWRGPAGSDHDISVLAVERTADASQTSPPPNC